ncbi:hypothetical protein DSECCO2_640980 [anaerobic digester metagenome]
MLPVLRQLRSLFQISIPGIGFLPVAPFQLFVPYLILKSKQTTIGVLRRTQIILNGLGVRFAGPFLSPVGIEPGTIQKAKSCGTPLFLLAIVGDKVPFFAGDEQLKYWVSPAGAYMLGQIKGHF